MPRGGKGGGGSGSSVIKGNRKNNLLTGTENADVMRGLDGHDTLFGLGGNDTLEGGNGNDTLDGGLGDDIVLGGVGTDVALFSGNRDDYTVTQIDANTIEISGPDGTDLFHDVETFVFADVTQTAAEVVVPRLANLFAAGLVIDDTALAPDDTATATWTVGSDGIIDALGSTTALYIATAPDLGAVVGALDVIAISALATGDAMTFTASFDSTGLTPGTYYIAAIADAGQDLAEESEADNLTGWIEITVEDPVANLSLDNAAIGPTSSFDLTEGAVLDLSYDVSNTGNTGNGAFLVITVLSRDAVLSEDDETISVLTEFLEPGQSGSYAVTMPIDSGFAPGDYYVIHTVDWINGGPEDASDNTIVEPGLVTLTGGTIIGTEGQDIVTGTTSDEDIVLLGGDDILFASDGMDFADGGTGTDIANFATRGEGIEVQQTYNFATSQVLLQVDQADWTQPDTWRTMLQDFEHIVGTDFDDVFYLGAANIVEIEAGSGDDQILGGDAAETIFAGAGNDLIGGLDGDDLIFTGSGIDEVYVGYYEDLAGTSGDGHDTVVDFDPLNDVLWIETPYDAEPVDLLSLASNTAEGARFDYADDSSILLLGVDLADLNETNVLQFQDQPPPEVFL